MGRTTTKVFFIATVILFVVTAIARAKIIPLAWNQNPESNIAGYRIYYKAGSSALPFDGSGAVEGDSPLDVGLVTSFSLSGLADGEDHYIAVTAYDEAGIESPYSNVVSSAAVVININHPPVLAAIGGKSIDQGATLSFGINASDPDGDSLVYTATDLPAGASFNAASHTFSWTPDASSQQTAYSVTFGVSDGQLGDSETVAIAVARDRDGDGVLDAQDAFPDDPGEWLDTDHDGIGNNADPDDDNDGISDLFDSAPLDPNLSGWTLSAIAGSGGTISPAGDTLVAGGASQLYTIGAATGYAIDEVLIDGSSVGPVAEYRFDDVASAHRIEALFVPLADGLRLTAAETGLPGVDRLDGGDDANNHVTGKPKGDVDYRFRVVLQENSGEPLPTVVLSLNGYAYVMERQSGMPEAGATYGVTLRLGPVADQTFHFEARAADGSLRYRLPAEADFAAPQVELLNGKNVIGQVGNIDARQLNSFEALGAAQAYRWLADGLGHGGYQAVDASGPVVAGEGYVIRRTTAATLPALGGDAAAEASEIPLQSGWNLIANPFAGNLSLAALQVRSGSAEPLSWAAAVANHLVIDGIYHYLGQDWGDTNLFESGDAAMLIPHIGYWIYVNSNDGPVTLVVPRPRQ